MAFKDLGVQIKVLLLAAILGASLVLVGAMGVYAIADLTADLDELCRQEMQQVRILNAARAYTRGVEANMLQLLLQDTDSRGRGDIIKQTEEYAATLGSLFADFGKTDLHNIDKGKFDKAKQEIGIAAQARREAVGLLENGNRAAAWLLYSKEAQPRIDSANRLLRELADAADQSAVRAKTQAEAMAKKLRFTMLCLTAAALVIGLVASLYIARRIAGPLRLVTSSAEAVANGDLSGKPIPVDGHDEIGRLTEAFNEMLGHLHALVKNSLQSAEKVAVSAQSLMNSSDQCSEAAQQITGSINEVSAASINQQEHVEQTSAAIEEISASIQEVSATAENLAQVADNTARTAQVGGEKVHRAVEEIRRVGVEAAAAGESVAELDEGSKKIAEIVELITGIANQTNLLALNAAIEAARAGEQGRGFAVVAEEVRKLAEDSAKAARHIGELIKQNEARVIRATKATEAAETALVSGQTAVEDAGSQFVQIVQSVTQLAKEMREISLAVEEAAKGTQQVVVSAERIDQGTKLITTEMQQVSSAMEEETASLEEVAAAGRAMDVLAEELLGQVKHFHV